jgi:hypothetical protein
MPSEATLEVAPMEDSSGKGALGTRRPWRRWHRQTQSWIPVASAVRRRGGANSSARGWERASV